MAKKEKPVTKKSLRKGSKKKVTDTFAKKEWFPLTVRGFPVTEVGKTPAFKKSAVEGRIFEVNQGDLGFNTDQSACGRVFSFKAAESGTVFNGMRLTRERRSGLVRKWHSLIEFGANVKTPTLNLRVFLIALTRGGRIAYATTSDQTRLRNIMADIIKEELSDCDESKLIKKLTSEKIGKEIEKRSPIPLMYCCTAKVKVLS